MSTHTFVTVDCDEPGCMEAHDAGATSIRQARDWARAAGWRYTTRLTEWGICRHIDLCPDHLSP